MGIFNRSALLKMLLITLTVTGMSLGMSNSVSAAVRVAIVPYINSSGENRAVVDETIKRTLASYFQSSRYELVPAADVTAFLASNYDCGPVPHLLPEKDAMAALANATGADVVLAMDFARIQASRRYTFFHSYTTGSISIYVKALTVFDDNFISLRIEKSARLKATRFGPGVREKTAIAAGIEAAMAEMFSKLPF